MQMNKVALIASAGLGLAFLAACSDSPMGVQSRTAFVPKSSFVVALGDVTNNTAEAGYLKICKLGNIGGTFVVTSEPGAGGTGGGSLTSPLTVAENECRIAGIDFVDATTEKGDIYHVSENAAADPANTTQVLTSCVGIEGASPCTGVPPVEAYNNNYFINDVHGVVVTYTNTFTEPPPPPAGCTYTQGYWKTHGYAPKGKNTNQWDLKTITLGTVEYSQADAQKIFDSAVKGNGLISLAHQLMAAKLNIANGASSATIAATIAAADALIGDKNPLNGGSLTPASVASLVTALTNFNEGTTGPGHCGDEVL